MTVIGNGDIFSARDAVNMLTETGCDGVMIGRKAIGNPFIFSRVLSRIRGETPPSENLEHRFTTLRRYLQNSVRYFGEELACRMMRSRLCWFVKGLKDSSQFRKSINQISTQNQALELISAYQEYLQRDL
jgi:tRNA-dihydrouridine synthase B